MAIKNYTSTVDPNKTINEIEQILRDHKIRQMHKFYDENGEVEGIYFTLPFGENMVHYKLPVQVDKVQQIMDDDPDVENYRVKNAKCVAWRNVKDWIDSQLAMVKINMVELHQVFLPYAYDPVEETTLYDKFKEGEMPHLLTD